MAAAAGPAPASTGLYEEVRIQQGLAAGGEGAAGADGLFGLRTRAGFRSNTVDFRVLTKLD